MPKTFPQGNLLSFNVVVFEDEERNARPCEAGGCPYRSRYGVEVNYPVNGRPFEPVCGNHLLTTLRYLEEEARSD